MWAPRAPCARGEDGGGGRSLVDKPPSEDLRVTFVPSEDFPYGTLPYGTLLQGGAPYVGGSLSGHMSHPNRSPQHRVFK